MMNSGYSAKKLKTLQSMDILKAKFATVYDAKGY